MKARMPLFSLHDNVLSHGNMEFMALFVGHFALIELTTFTATVLLPYLGPGGGMQICMHSPNCRQNSSLSLTGSCILGRCRGRE
jgi:hypothetical protein